MSSAEEEMSGDFAYANKRKSPFLHDNDSDGNSKKRSSKKGKSSGVDLSTVEGQLAGNPNLALEDAKVQAKREYNRQNAARARARNKEMLEDLQQKVAFLTKRTEELERENEVLRAQVKVLTRQQEHQQPPNSNNAGTNNAQYDRQAAAPQTQHIQSQPQQQQQPPMDVGSLLAMLQAGTAGAALMNQPQAQMPQQVQQQQQQQPQYGGSYGDQRQSSVPPNMNGLFQALGNQPQGLGGVVGAQATNNNPSTTTNNNHHHMVTDINSLLATLQQQQAHGSPPRVLSLLNNAPNKTGLPTGEGDSNAQQNYPQQQPRTIPRNIAGGNVDSNNNNQGAEKGSSTGGGSVTVNNNAASSQQNNQVNGNNGDAMLNQLLGQVPQELLMSALNDLGLQQMLQQQPQQQQQQQPSSSNDPNLPAGGG